MDPALMATPPPPSPQPSSLTVFCPCESAAGQLEETGWAGGVLGEAAGARGGMGICFGAGSSEASRRVREVEGPGP